MNGSVRVVAGGMVGAVAGVGGAGLACAAVCYRPAFLSVSALMMATSVWLTFRHDSAPFTKTLAASAAIIAFALSAAFMGN